MDILLSTNQKLQKADFEIPSGIKAVLAHIEVAEKRFQSAKRDRDNSLYTDVIYRTNQAFEGILKEGYTILANKDSSKVSSNDIEKYLLDNHVFKERVMELFKNYRQNWRNPSTHNHQLFFSEEEAFLAIVTVSAFTYILFDQILEKLSYQEEKANIDIQAKEIRKSLVKYSELEPIEKIRAILEKLFLEIRHDKKFVERTESQQRGLVSGFLASIEPDIKIDFEPKITKDPRWFPLDFICDLDGQRIVLQLNRNKIDLRFEPLDFPEIEKWLLANEIKRAVLFYFPVEPTDEPLTTIPNGETGTVKIIAITPITKELSEEMAHYAAQAAQYESNKNENYDSNDTEET